MATCVLDSCPRPVAHLVICSMHYRRLARNGTVHEMRPEDWFFRHVTEDPDGCWNYHPVHPVTGYAEFTVGKGTRRVLAHRWSYGHFIAPIPAGLEIDHLCKNTACVNPWHLEPVTHEVNTQRGVGTADACVNGHPYDASNTHVRPNGHRQCRTCRQNTERRHLAASNPA